MSNLGTPQIPQDDFIVLNKEQYSNSLGQYLPDGKLTIAKNIPSSNLKKLLNGLSIEGIRAENLIQQISINHDINQTIYYIDEWESAVGIPDNCFSGTGTIEERRLDVLVKYARMNLTTKQDFIDLAALYGYPITITSGYYASLFPWCFPHYFYGGPTSRFVIIVDFLTVPGTGGFPQCFPWYFESTVTSKIECIFKKCVPANVLVLFKYSG